jgi:hypothetical protein
VHFPLFLATSTECSAGSNDHIVVVVLVVVVLLLLFLLLLLLLLLPSLVQFDGRPLGGTNFQY